VTLRSDIRDLFTFRDSPTRWPVALQAAFAIGLPITIFTLAGQPQLGLLASSGGFTALYLANRSRRERAVLLPLVGLGLIAASALGALVSFSEVLSLTALFVVVIVAAVLTLGLGVGPPGALFFMLVTGVAIRLTAPASLDGDGLSAFLVVGMLAIGVVIAYLVVLAPLLLPSVRRRDALAHADRTRLRYDLTDDTRVIIIRLAIASLIGVVVSAPLGVHRTYWVLLTVIAILQNGRRLRLTALRGIHRVLGTLVGLGLFSLILLAGPEGLWLALTLAALQFIVELVVIRNYGLALVFITPLALLIAAQGDPRAVGEVTLTRVVDTLLGAVIALVVLLAALLVRRMRRNSTPRTAG
jgi:hypothetical protein